MGGGSTQGEREQTWLKMAGNSNQGSNVGSSPCGSKSGKLLWIAATYVDPSMKLSRRSSIGGDRSSDSGAPRASFG